MREIAYTKDAYGLFYEEREHKLLIEGSKDYLNAIKKLIKK